jgi:hypothetical protein
MRRRAGACKPFRARRAQARIPGASRPVEATYSS